MTTGLDGESEPKLASCIRVWRVQLSLADYRRGSEAMGEMKNMVNGVEQDTVYLSVCSSNTEARRTLKAGISPHHWAHFKNFEARLSSPPPPPPLPPAEFLRYSFRTCLPAALMTLCLSTPF